MLSYAQKKKASVRIVFNSSALYAGHLNITEADLIELFEVSTKNQLFQFQGVLYKQVDGVAMGSPLGLLMANAFMCYMKEQLAKQNKMPTFYKRYIDDTSA